MVSTTSEKISTNPYNLYSNHIYPHQPDNASKFSDDTTNPYALYSNYTHPDQPNNATKSTDDKTDQSSQPKYKIL